MRWIRFFALLPVLFCFFCTGAFAVSSLEDEIDTKGILDSVPSEAQEVLQDYSPLDTESDGAIGRLLDYIKGKAGEVFAQTIGSVVKILAVVLVCSLVSGMNLFKGGFDYVNLAGCLAIAALAISDVNSVIRMGAKTLEDISVFSKALLPTLATAATAAGATTSAGIKYAATSMFMDVLISAATSVVFPLMYAYTACVLASCAIGDKRLDAAVKLIKKVTVIIITALVSVFTFYLSASGVVAASTDAAASKLVKTAVSALPVVGRTISDAASTIVSGAGIIRSSIGVFGLVAILAICALPILRLAVKYLLFKATASIAEPIAGERVSKLIDGISSVYGMVVGMVGVGAVFMFFSIISLIKVVSG